MTVVSVILLLVYVNFDILTILINMIYRDSLVSSWSVYYKNRDQLPTIGIAALYFGVCWLWAGRKRPISASGRDLTVTK